MNEEQQPADLNERVKTLEAALAASKRETERYPTLARELLQSIPKIMKGESKGQSIETVDTVRNDECLLEPPESSMQVPSHVSPASDIVDFIL